MTPVTDRAPDYDLIILTRASEDIAAAMKRYDYQVRGLGGAFLFEVNQQLGRILRFPHSYPVLSGTRRRCVMHRFPFLIVYRVKKRIIEIVAVTDSRRDPAAIAAHH